MATGCPRRHSDAIVSLAGWSSLLDAELTDELSPTDAARLRTLLRRAAARFDQTGDQRRISQAIETRSSRP